MDNTQEGQVEEPVVSEPEGEQIISEEVEPSDVDNPKSYKFFQSKFTHAQKETVQEREARIRAEERAKFLEEQLNSIKAPKVEERVPQKPNFPAKPKDFNQADIFDMTTPSGQWYAQKLDYDEAYHAYDQYWKQRTESEREKELKAKQESELTKKQEEEFVKFKNFKIAEFQKVPGTSLQEAIETFEFSMSDESLKPENLVEYKRFVRSKKLNKLPTEQPGKVAPPVNVGGSPSAPKEESYTKSRSTDWMYKTK